MSHEMGELKRSVDQTIRLYASGLLEYPTLLRTFRRFEQQHDTDQECWSRFWETYNRGSEAGETPLAVPEAYLNLLALADAAVDIVVAATLVIGDWEDLPDEMEARGSRVIHVWRYSRNDHDPFGVFASNDSQASEV